MRIISHRGNLCGPNPRTENDPVQIAKCIEKCNLEVEIDLWYIPHSKDYFLGHDYPTYKVKESFLWDCHRWLWIHCKTPDTLYMMTRLSSEYNFFWHEDDAYTLTSKGHIWTHYKTKTHLPNSIVVCLDKDITNKIFDERKVQGICTDYIIE